MLSAVNDRCIVVSGCAADNSILDFADVIFGKSDNRLAGAVVS